MNLAQVPTSAVSRILSGEHTENDLDQLIELFSSGRSLSLLETLIDDPRRESSVNGLYILSEVGRSGWPLTPKAVNFLGHPNEMARFFAISCILSAPQTVTDDTVAQVLRMITDGSKRVRWRVIDFASMTEDRFMRPALVHFCDSDEDRKHAAGITLLLEASVRSADEMLAAIESSDPIERGYGIAAAARLIIAGRRVATKASKVGDQAVSEFARSFL